MYPIHRMRRMRRTDRIRRMVQETRFDRDQLIMPIVVVPGMDKDVVDIEGALRGVSVDGMHAVARQVHEAGLAGLYVYGVAETRDESAQEAASAAGAVQRAVRAVKHLVPQLVVMTDVCVCRYTDTGHCGLVEAGVVHNEATLETLQRIALSHAAAGADFLVPTGMMDGSVAAIRHALDEGAFEDVGIVGGSALFDSALADGPGLEVPEDAGGTSGALADRGSYRMHPANTAEALREAALDIEEGADMVMVAPALLHLDIIHRVKETFQAPVAAMTTGEEAAMVRAAVAQNPAAGERVIYEQLLAQMRAGADVAITPLALDIARFITQQRIPPSEGD